MNLDIYHIKGRFSHTRFMFPVMLDVLRLWSREQGHHAMVRILPATRVKYDSAARVVAFCVYTNGAPEVYRASDQLRRQGKIVVLGGPHFSSSRTVEEGRRHADILIRSVHRGQWEDLLQRIERGAISREPDGGEVIEDVEGLFDFPENFHLAYKEKRYLEFPLIFTSLGCPFACEYCTPFLPGKYIPRDIDRICREIGETRATALVIADATFGLRKQHTLDLMKAVAPMRKKFFVETTTNCMDDDEILDAMAEGGVKWIALGIENLSLNAEKHGAKGTAPDTSSLKRILKKIANRGILTQGNFICGLDTDTAESFDEIYDFFMNNEMGTIYADMMIPYPGSALFSRLLVEGRINDTSWDHYDFEHVVFEPANMCPVELMDRYIDLYARLTSVRVLARKTLEVFRATGVSQAAISMTVWNIFKTMEAPFRKRRLRRNRRTALVRTTGYRTETRSREESIATTQQ